MISITTLQVWCSMERMRPRIIQEGSLSPSLKKKSSVKVPSQAQFSTPTQTTNPLHQPKQQFSTIPSRCIALPLLSYFYGFSSAGSSLRQRQRQRQRKQKWRRKKRRSYAKIDNSRKLKPAPHTRMIFKERLEMVKSKYIHEASGAVITHFEGKFNPFVVEAFARILSIVFSRNHHELKPNDKQYLTLRPDSNVKIGARYSWAP